MENLQNQQIWAQLKLFEARNQISNSVYNNLDYTKKVLLMQEAYTLVCMDTRTLNRDLASEILYVEFRKIFYEKYGSVL